MPFLTWTNDLSVGVPVIDGQHKTLVNILNELHDAMKLGNGERVTRALLYKLLDYTREHFAAEEKLMEAAGYPELQEHRLQHVALTAKVVDLVTRLDEGGCSLNVDLLFFLRDWLQTHIVRQDKAYGPWLTGRVAVAGRSM
jgi:hemerythrin